MSQIGANDWEMLEQAYAFIGNSLLTPMTRTSDVGISPSFWEEFPALDNEHVRNGRAKLIAYTSQNFESHEKAVEKCSVEFTKLFIGPSQPAAAPWETLNKSEEGTAVGFGQATFEMRRKLAEAGLALDNENNQYEDHMGIELLYLSVLCGKIARGEQANEEGSAGAAVFNPSAADVKTFIEEHPLSWIEFFRNRIDEAYPKGYFTGLVELAQGILEWHSCN